MAPPQVSAEILKKMKQALDKKETFFTLAKPHQPQPNPTHIQSHYHHTLFVILDHHCFSSCLIFASQLARYPNTIFIGQPTASVTHYGEINTINLTGGATLQYPMAVYRGENPLFYGPIQPQFEYSGDIQKTQPLINWLKKIKKR